VSVVEGTLSRAWKRKSAEPIKRSACQVADSVDAFVDPAPTRDFPIAVLDQAGIACILLIVSGGATWYSRTLPCPADPAAAQACQKLRRINFALYSVALVSFAVGLAFAFVLPKLM